MSYFIEKNLSKNMSNKKELLTIIIPVYNVEKYIGHCLESVCSQIEIREGNDVEVIVVNDGTPDKSMDIVEQYAGKHKNLTIINQENQGLSAARNTGLAAAKGDYVWFVDSDDWLLPNAISFVLSEIKENPSIDVFATILIQQQESTGKSFVEYSPKMDVKTGREYMFAENRLGASQRYILRRDFLQSNGIEFMRGVYHEDGEFGRKMMYQAKTLKMLPKPVYCYLLRAEGSITSTRKPKMNTDMLLIYDECERFAKEKVSKEDYWRFMALNADCVYDTILFSNKIIFTDEFKSFYRQHKGKIHSVAKEMIKHPMSMSWKHYRLTIRMLLFPLFWTQFKQIVKKVLNKR